MHRYEDLDVWRLAYSLTLEVYKDTRSFPAEERYGLTAQLRRAAVSVVSNIAEGCGRRTNGEFSNELSVAGGSAMEVQCQLRLAADLQYMSQELAAERCESWDRVQKMIYRLEEALSAPPRR